MRTVLSFTFLTPLIFLISPLGAQVLEKDSRSFEELNSYYERVFEEQPELKGRKQIERSLHHWRSHLNDQGEMFNYGAGKHAGP